MSEKRYHTSTVKITLYNLQKIRINIDNVFKIVTLRQISTLRKKLNKIFFLMASDDIRINLIIMIYADDY